MPHRDDACEGQHEKVQIPDRLPEAEQESQQNSQRREVSLEVVAEELRISEDKSGVQVVVGVPEAKGHGGSDECQGAATREDTDFVRAEEAASDFSEPL